MDCEISGIFDLRFKHSYTMIGRILPYKIDSWPKNAVSEPKSGRFYNALCNPS